jgi:hypothetical protein
VLDPALLPAIEIGSLPVRERSISVNTMGVLPSGSTVQSGGFGNSGIEMPDGGTSSFAFALTVPPDFVGDALTLRIGWRSRAESCEMQLLPNAVDRWRPGFAPASGSSNAGFTGPALPMTVTTADLGEVSEYTITGGSTYTELLPGDGLTASLYRSSSDDCAGSLFVTSIEVIYDAQ